MLNEINSDNPVEEVEASDIKEDNTSVESSTPSEEIIKTKDYLSKSLFEDVKTITSEDIESQSVESSEINNFAFRRLKDSSLLFELDMFKLLFFLKLFLLSKQI